MNVRNNAIRIGQVGVLLLVAIILFYWWSVRPPAVVSDDAVDDLIEQVGDTYVPVHVGQIERGTLRQYVTAYGTVQPASAMAGHEAASANVSSAVSAVVATVACSEGQLVERGAPLFMLDPRSADAAIQQAQQLVSADQAAVAEMKSAPTTAFSTTAPAATAPVATAPTATAPATTATTTDATPRPWWAINSERQLAADQAALEKAQAQRKLLTVVAPIAGTITDLNIAAGEIADPRKVAVEMVDLNRLVVTVDVPAASLDRLQVGQDVKIDLRSSDSTTQPSTQASPLAGNLVLIDPTISPSTGMGSADIEIASGSGLRPGQFVRAQITTGAETDRLIVPTPSITQDQYGQPAVGRVETDGRWSMLVPVKIGWRDGDKTEIEGDGLEAGQQIVTIGANGLVQRTRLHLLKD